MRMTYRFPGIPRMKDLRLEIENRGPKLGFSLSGRGAYRYYPLVWYFLRWLSGLGVIGIRDGANIYSLYIPPIPSAADNRHLEIFLNAWLFGKKIPFAVTIAVTDACPLNCWHCSVPKSAAGKTPLGTGEIKRVIAECLELGVTNITFTGGEPLLRGDLEELIASVPFDKAVSLVFTNAAELTPERAASIRKAGAVGIQISLDSPDPGEHDSRRGRPGLFDLVKSGTENALRAGLLVGLSTYASNESIAQRKLTRITQLAAEWGAHEISVFDLIPTGRLLHAADALITPDHRRWLLREAKDLNKRFRGKPRVITQSWTNCGKGFARFIGCLAGHYQFHISAGGEFMPCDFTPLSFGNVRVFSISALWAKVLKHPAYSGRSHACRIQDLEFRKKYIDPLPPDADLPAPIEPHG